MKTNTALTLLKFLIDSDELHIDSNTISIAPGSCQIHPKDVHDALHSLLNPSFPRCMLHSSNMMTYTLTHKSAEYLHRALKIKPRAARENTPNLPTLFIGSERTQIRQIPLVSEAPYPFHFLMELGGCMVLDKNVDPFSFYEQLAQYLNNHPQYEIKVEIKDCPDGTWLAFTYWFNKLDKISKRTNINLLKRSTNRIPE